jgi:hypothetical protein
MGLKKGKIFMGLKKGKIFMGLKKGKKEDCWMKFTSVFEHLNIFVYFHFESIHLFTFFVYFLC